MSHYPQDWIYGIINTTDLPNVDFTQVYPTEQTALRYSLDTAMFVLKWNTGHEPTFITDGTIVPVSILSHSDCLTLMQTTEWTEPIPVE
jgi:hypothetical protein